jgi:hypothetical protein
MEIFVPGWACPCSDIIPVKIVQLILSKEQNSHIEGVQTT